MSSEQEVREQRTRERAHHDPPRLRAPPGGMRRPANYVTRALGRREFASELSRAVLRGANTMTMFGQLGSSSTRCSSRVSTSCSSCRSVAATRGHGFFAQLCGGLFIFYFVAGSMSTGAASVVGGGKLLLNTAFPRLFMPVLGRSDRVLPVSADACRSFPSSTSSRAPLGHVMLAVYPSSGCIIVFALGIASFFATMQVYFRDTTSFMPYFNRIWLYLSPVLWTIDDVPYRFQRFTTSSRASTRCTRCSAGSPSRSSDGIVP